MFTKINKRYFNRKNYFYKNKFKVIILVGLIIILNNFLRFKHFILDLQKF
jgi:hypothetical protein